MRLIELLEYATYDDMVRKLQSIYALVQRGATTGEQTAAKLAFDRMVAAIERDFGANQAKNAEATVKRSGGSSSGTKSQSSYRSSTRQKPKDKPKYSSSSSSYHDNTYTDPNTGWSFIILRFVDSMAGKRGSNKVWGYAERNGEYVSFWGAFGKAVRTKPLSSNSEAVKLYSKKLKKGYQKYDVARNPSEYAFIFNQFS